MLWALLSVVNVPEFEMPIPPLPQRPETTEPINAVFVMVPIVAPLAIAIAFVPP